MNRLSVIPLFLTAATAAAADPPGNRLRNGSFEGAAHYWYEAAGRPVVGDAAHGRFALQIDKGGVQSAAFRLEPGKPVTIAFSAKADADTTVGWQCTPCAREVAMRVGQTWGMKAAHPVRLTTEWKRYAFEFTPTAPQDGFWPHPTYMLQLGDGDKPWLVDAVTVGYGAGGDGYVPYREVEAQVACPDLNGYTADGNLLAHGRDVRLTGHVSNPGPEPRDLRLRWQWVDYEGERAFGEPVEKVVTVRPGDVVTETATLPLTPRGLVRGRFTVLAGDRVLDSSDVPVCSLPYPQAATKPDPRERFGGSFFGPHTAGLGSKIGLRWGRWCAPTQWANTQPDGPDDWKSAGPVLDRLAGQGVAVNAVLYSKPKWAFADEADPLPRDMQWGVDDARWDDLSTLTAWDKYVVRFVEENKHRGDALVYEIENEPVYNWKGKEKLYAKFTVRTVRLIKRANPAAKVMVDNVYGIPDGVNAAFLAAGGAEFIDIISWHDYHEGRLTDAAGFRRSRGRLDDAGGKHVAIWFNEGWAYTNTAVDEPAVALTRLDAAQSTNAMAACVAELTALGQDKTILFHTGYEQHGMSFWDYSGPGTMLWDWYGYPLPLVPAWNTLAHHIGVSDRAGYVRPPGGTLCVFDDKRNGRGVVAANADDGATADVTVDFGVPDLVAEDVMGNPWPVTGGKVTLPKTGRLVFVWSKSNLPGKAFVDKLSPLDRKNARFVAADGKTYRLPLAWDGSTKGSADGNPATADGKPVWRLLQLWPDKPDFAENYVPLVWGQAEWAAASHGAGGQPTARVRDGRFEASGRGFWRGTENERTAALAFVAPAAGRYKLTGVARCQPWEGSAAALELEVRKKDTQRAPVVEAVKLPRGTDVPFAVTVDLSAGHELLLLPRVPHWHTASAFTVRDVAVEAVK